VIARELADVDAGIVNLQDAVRRGKATDMLLGALETQGQRRDVLRRELETLSRGVMTEGIEAIAKMVTALNAAQYTPAEYEKTARSVAHLQKAIDGLVRLAEVATGKPDSRPDTGSDWLRGLTNEQFAIVSSWVEANGAAEAARPDCARGAAETDDDQRQAQSR
jgi:hypothetical protein